MREYELLYVARPDLDEEQAAALHNRIAAVINEQQGHIGEVKPWGLKHLSYEIADFHEGMYIELKFQGPPQIVAELERVISITEGILRHIVIKVGE